jgi:peptidyl-prolyl cis-trans isomerase D
MRWLHNIPMIPGSKDKGGVYDYFTQGKMVVPFNDFAFDKPVGSKGVVKVDYGYHYVEVLGQKNPNPAYKIAYLARLIQPSNETISAANNAAAQFGVSSKDAKSFNANAMKANLPVLGANDIKENDFNINGLGNNRQLVRWIYDHKAGEVSEPFEMGDQYVVAVVTSVNKAGVMNAAEARATVEPIVRNEKKAKQIIETKFKGNTLESYASSIGTIVSHADSINFAAPFVPGVGNEPKSGRRGFQQSIGWKSKRTIWRHNRCFCCKSGTNRQQASCTGPGNDQTIPSANGKMASYRSIDALKKAATIKDFRSKFY